MKKWIALMPVFMLAAALMVGCGAGDDEKKDDKKTSSNDVKTTNVSVTKVCGMCGQDAEEGCCEKGEDCSECDFKAGSKLCCTGVAQTEGAYCSKCGEVAGTESCCADDAEVCEGCSLHKGSPLCCKLNKETESKE